SISSLIMLATRSVQPVLLPKKMPIFAVMSTVSLRRIRMSFCANRETRTPDFVGSTRCCNYTVPLVDWQVSCVPGEKWNEPRPCSAGQRGDLHQCIAQDRRAQQGHKAAVERTRHKDHLPVAERVERLAHDVACLQPHEVRVLGLLEFGVVGRGVKLRARKAGAERLHVDACAAQLDLQRL